MSMNLFSANKQWSTRPNDERFNSLAELRNVCLSYAESAREKDVPVSLLRTEANNGEVTLVGKAGVPALLTHWAFGQLSVKVGAPANYLRSLPATLACQLLNHGLADMTHANDAAMASLLFHSNGSLLLRAITSDQYARIWNWEVAERLMGLEEKGWEPARPDSHSLAQDKQVALYASDHDMYAMLRQSNAALVEAGKDAPLWRGIIVENSEVGASALKVTRFLYRYMCGNHIIWGASEVMDLSLRHRGDIAGKWMSFAATLRKWADESSSDEQAKIKAAQTRIIAGTKEQVLDAVFGKRSIGLSRKVIAAGYDAVVPHQDGAPNSVWGLLQGITRHSQTIPYADERLRVDKAAGKLLEATF